MKILWLTNLPLPWSVEQLNLNKNISGSWLGAMKDILQRLDDIELFVLSPCGEISQNKTIVNEAKNVTHILFIPTENNQELFKEILQEIKPDVVNIHGTEYKHSLDMAMVSDASKTVVSLQGIMAAIAESFQMGLDKSYKVIDWWHKLLQIRYQTRPIKTEQDAFDKGAVIERQTLKLVKYVVGRTEWDKQMALSINPQLQYFTVNETLRDEFYTDKMWSYDSCEKHSLFFSQAFYPVKGFHQFLKIAPRLKARYPDLKIYVGGPELYHKKFALSTYAYDLMCDYKRYLKKLARVNNVDACMIFTSKLSSLQMREYYLSCNAFVSCSSIENESNSIGEAKMLAVPIVASLVGGVTSRIEHNADALGYDFFDTEALYSSICKIFDNPDLAAQLGRRAKENMSKICDKAENSRAIYNVYKTIEANIY